MKLIAVLSQLFVANFFLVGCAGPTIAKHAEAMTLNSTQQSLTQEHRDYLAKISNEPLTIKVSEQDAPKYWQRANYWVSAYSGMKLQIANDVTIQTYNPLDHGAVLDITYGYNVYRRPLEDKNFEIRVECLASRRIYPTNAETIRKVWEQRRDLNARILAHYIRTGEVREEMILKSDLVPNVIFLGGRL